VFLDGLFFEREKQSFYFNEGRPVTASLNNVAIKQFDNEFSISYQASRVLMGTTMERHNLVGDSFQWPLIGGAVMQPRGAAQSLVPASDVDHTPITQSFEPFALNLPTDIFQQSEVNVDERKSLALDHALAAGRRPDQFVINALALAAASPLTTIIPALGTNLTVKKLRKAHEILGQKNIFEPGISVYCAMTFSQNSSLLAETEIININFATQKAITSGKIGEVLNFNYITLGERPEGGLPFITPGIRRVFVWSQRAIGLGFSLDPVTNIEWSVERQSWLSVSRLRAGSVVLRPEGMVVIECDETPTP